MILVLPQKQHRLTDPFGYALIAGLNRCAIDLQANFDHFALVSQTIRLPGILGMLDVHPRDLIGSSLFAFGLARRSLSP